MKGIENKNAYENGKDKNRRKKNIQYRQKKMAGF